MKIIHKYQPKKSQLCGQACVAMICNIPLHDAIKAVGKKTTTYGIDLINGVRRFNIKCSDKMIRFYGQNKLDRKSDYYDSLPRRCIAKVRSKGFDGSHWVLIYDGKTYDPYPGYVPWQYISGYIEIE